MHININIEYKGHKLFAFADTHGMYWQLRVPSEADILICAGDACEGFAPDELKDFFAWYHSIPAKLRIFVAGNHDMVFDQQPETRALTRNFSRTLCSRQAMTARSWPFSFYVVKTKHPALITKAGCR